MGKAKRIILKPVSARLAERVIRKHHYSGKVVNNSSLHFGVYLDGKIEGVLSYGSSLDKRKMVGLVEGTLWNDFLELNRMAFSDKLPRNSESRAIAISIRLIKRHYHNIKWIVSFADGTQCGDGTIYRASGFSLIKITKNNQIIEFPDGLRETRFVLTGGGAARIRELAKRYGVTVGGGASMKAFYDIGARPLDGNQLKYIYFIDKSAKDRLTVPILDFSEIEKKGAGMYKGKARNKQATTETIGRAEGQYLPLRSKKNNQNE